jgi:hypothetical protein
MKHVPAVLLGLAFAVAVVGCDVRPPTSTQVEQRKQEQMKMQADQSVGMPAIVNWQEKRILKNILELRDQEIKTVTYTQDLQAHLHKLCDSVGYGIPYATQYTNPQRVLSWRETDEHGNIAIAQADPNGLYSPAAAEGTWVMCLNPQDGKLAPVYVEPRIIVSPFPLQQ